jgi:hypothetical protein
VGKRKIGGKALTAGVIVADRPRPGERPSGATRTTRSKKKPVPIQVVRGEPAIAPPLEPSSRTTRVATETGPVILAELRGLRDLVQRLAPPDPAPGRLAFADDSDWALEGAVDSLRRLLSELIERRMESVVAELVAIRGEALALPAVARGKGGIIERMEEMLASLGAVRFDAEPMALLDPLIHTIASERYEEGVPDGVILETVRPGYRSARRVVLCKAAVVVNRRN